MDGRLPIGDVRLCPCDAIDPESTIDNQQPIEIKKLKSPMLYFVSLCAVCLRQNLQYLLISSRSVVFFLFFVVL